MISVLLSAGLICTSVLFGAPDKRAENLLKTYSSKLYAAKSLTVDVEAYQGAVMVSKASMTLAKPDLARFESGGRVKVFDGKKMSEYFAGKNQYYSHDVRKDELISAMYYDEYMAWMPFFNEDVNAAIKTATYDGKDTIEKTEYDVVKFTVDKQSKKSARLYFDPADGLVKHVEYSVGADQKKTLVLSSNFALNSVADNATTFKLPEGAAQVDEADLVGVKWYYDYDEGLAAAKSNGKIMLVDFYADW